MRLVIAWVLVAATWACLIAAATGETAALLGCAAFSGATAFVLWGVPAIQRRLRTPADRIRPSPTH